MNKTKIMLAVIGTFIVTWVVLGLLCMFFSEYTNLSDAMQNGLVLIIMIIFGWIPCLIVGHDLFEKLERVEE
jgi:cytochrome c biogenesis protein CcdA